jgi:glyoxylase-like metal-dependent hydrolase (beta-lactamase superfamily II)
VAGERAVADVKGFFDPETGTVSYVVSDPATRRAAVLDSLLSFDPKSGRTGTSLADAIVGFVRESGLTVDWLLETHVHADHLSALPYLKRQIGGQTGIGANLPAVQQAFKDIFNVERDFHLDGRQFDHLFADDEVFAVGTIPARVLLTPGHTPACVSYLIGDAVFVGDTLFMPDSGTARCDFPGGDAKALYRSVQRLYALPPETRMFICHDYQPGGRAPAFATTVAAQREGNIHISDATTEDAFVALRTARDRTLAMPVLILPSVQVNIRAGEMPPAEDNGVIYLKIPVNRI